MRAKSIGPAMAVALAAGIALVLTACTPEPTAAPLDTPNRPAAASEPATVLAAIARLPEFTAMRRALTETGRAAALNTRAPVTLLAARDTAFARLAPETRAAVFAPENRQLLGRTIDLHILSPAVRAEELRQMIVDGGGTARLASRGGTLTFSSIGDQILVTAPNGAIATMGTQDIATGNGSVYVLDRWLGTATGE